MADSNSLIHPSKTPHQKAQQSPTIPFSNFIYKAVFVCVLVALLPIFPSHSPELASKTILGRSWELLHLLLVGIAISYGLFSRRNSDHDVVDTNAPPHSYVSRAQLHVSSVVVFGDEEPAESPRGPPELPDERTKTQTWNYSQYNPGEPVVMVAKENGTAADGSKGATKPLFLPARSLKSTQGDDDDDGGGVLPSPVPWRSRSGRMEVKEEAPSSPPISESEAKSCPSRLSPSPSVSSISEDSGRKKSFYKPTPPPPAPPPLPLVRRHNIVTTERKDGRRSFKYELEHLSTRGRGRGRFLPHSDELGLDPPAPPDDGPCGVRSARAKDQPQRPRWTLPTSRSRKKKKKKDEFREKMIIESDSSDSSDDAESEMSDVGEPPDSAAAPAGPEEENEVDKKADEFIAKFREQIMLRSRDHRLRSREIM